jgi:hypothetical protein
MDKQGAALFCEEARALGYEPQEAGPNLVYFAYTIENGPRRGEQVDLGFEVPENYSVEPPHGPCYRPAILRDKGLDGVHPDRHFGAGWDHWSRPMEGWSKDRTLRAYMRHVRRLSEELPAAEEST